MPETNLEPKALDRVDLFGQGKLTHNIPPLSPREALHGDTANLEESKMCTWDLWAQKRHTRGGEGKENSSPGPDQTLGTFHTLSFPQKIHGR